MDQKLISVMKKLLVIISMLALAIGCETMYGPEQTPLTPDKTDGIAITVNSVADSTVSFTLAPVGEASYYSYLVDDSPKAVALDSSALIALQYSSVAQGTVKWSAEAPSKVVELKDLMPNTTYQIYAVAASPMGFVSSVAVTSFKTSDNEVPVLDVKKSAVADTLVTLTFSEDVVLAEGAQIIAAYYAINDPGFAQQTPVGVLPADTVYVKGNVVTAEFTSLPAGAYYAVNYAEGTIKDPTGNPAAALKSAMMLHPEGGPIGAGVYGQIENVNFELIPVAEKPETLVKDMTAMVMFKTEGVIPVKTGKEADGSILYEGKGESHTYTTSYGVDFGWADAEGGVWVCPNDPQYTSRPDPTRGNDVTITIAEGALVDLYGNVNDEYVMDTFLYSYGYALEDVLGDYSGMYYSAYDGLPYNGWDISVAEVTEEEMKAETFIEGCNVKLTKFKLPAANPIYAHFDVDMGTLTIPTAQVYNKVTLGSGIPAFIAFMTSTSSGTKDEETPTVFNMPEVGVLTCETLFGLYFYDEEGEGLGFNDISGYFQAEKVEAPAEPAPASARTFSYRPVGTKLIVK